MTPLLAQFVSEARDALQSIGDGFMALEAAPADPDALNALFRAVHTLKGNSGLFDLPEMTRVLHAAEDLMDAVRRGRRGYDRGVADALLEATDFVSARVDDAEAERPAPAAAAAQAVRLAEALRGHIGGAASATASPSAPAARAPSGPPASFARVPPALRASARRRLREGRVAWLVYRPSPDCFFQGDDPLLRARTTPGAWWATVTPSEPWPPLADLDAYRCTLEIGILTDAPLEALVEHYRYVPDQVEVAPLSAEWFSVPRDAPEVLTVLADQRWILDHPEEGPHEAGRLASVAASLAGVLRATGDTDALDGLAAASGDRASLLAWLRARTDAAPAEAAEARRPPDAQSRGLRVDAGKVDRLMNLIGEMVVAKNALPFLARRAEEVFGSRDLAREIKGQYAIVHRIVQEMQDAILQIRMVPVSAVVQRFPRLVREISHKLGKDVRLVLEGEGTEADKNVIEALGDPLVHLVRNSLDHGLEGPDERVAAGKSSTGTLRIRAWSEGGRVWIEVSDDGRGIDADRVKRKALERGLIDEATAARLTEEEAANLIFAPGLSTAEAVSDLSGRGVGMDAVATAVQRVNGTVSLRTERGRGTRVVLSLPLSVTVTHVMLVEADGQTFGVPIESVLETVRVPRASVRSVKQRAATVLRDRVVPLKSVGDLLGLEAPPRATAEDELSVLVVRHGGQPVGLMVDEFRATAEVIVKPLEGALGGLGAYSGSALMGDGSVLMVLNVAELM
jgi:two-component system, chemotaxis family, sensor kinase CheA